MSGSVRADDVEALIGSFQASDCTELHVRFDNFELFLSTDPAATVPGGAPAGLRGGAADPVSAPTHRPAAAPRVDGGAVSAPPPAGAEDLSGFEIVRAPYMGIFYRAPKPGEPAFVEVGSVVGPDTDLCLVEVMKLFTAVRAGLAGTVAQILAADGAMVDARQPLFALQPTG